MDPLTISLIGIGSLAAAASLVISAVQRNTSRRYQSKMIYLPDKKEERMPLQYECKSISCFKQEITRSGLADFLFNMNRLHGITAPSADEVCAPFVHHWVVLKFVDISVAQPRDDDEAKFLFVAVWPTHHITCSEFDSEAEAELFGLGIASSDTRPDPEQMPKPKPYWSANVLRTLSRPDLENVLFTSVKLLGDCKPGEFALDLYLRVWAFKDKSPVQIKYEAKRNRILKPLLNTQTARTKITALGDIATLNILDYNICVVGVNNSGKSQFIRTWMMDCHNEWDEATLCQRGVVLPDSGPGDTTTAPKRYSFRPEGFAHQITMFDMPAGGTLRIRADAYVNTCLLGLFDAVIVFRGEASSELEYSLLRAAQQEQVPVFFVYHKFDQQVNSHAIRCGTTPEDAEAECKRILQESHSKSWDRLDGTNICPTLFFASSLSRDYMDRYTRPELMVALKEAMKRRLNL